MKAMVLKAADEVAPENIPRPKARCAPSLHRVSSSDFYGSDTPSHMIPRAWRVAIQLRPEEQGEMDADPVVFPIGCEGVITNCKKQPDGTYKLSLFGVRRFRIRDEPARPAGVLYRNARIEPLTDAFPPSDRKRVAELREQVFDQMRELTSGSAAAGARTLVPELFEGVDDETFVNALAQSMQFEVSEKQGLVEADSVLERYRRLASMLRFQLAEMRTPQGQSSRSIH